MSKKKRIKYFNNLNEFEPRPMKSKAEHSISLLRVLNHKWIESHANNFNQLVEKVPFISSINCHYEIIKALW